MDANRMLAGRYIKASDLRGRRVILEIERVEEMRFDGKLKMVLYFTGHERGFVANVTNTRTLIDQFRTANTDAWIGKEVCLEPKRVEFSGQLVDAIRVGPPPRAARRPGPEPVQAPAPAPPAPREPGADDDAAFEASDLDVPFVVAVAPLLLTLGGMLA